MNLRKRRQIGILMLLIFIFGISSIVYVIEETDYLLKLPQAMNQVYIGAMSQLLMVLVYMALIALISPIIKAYDENASSYFLVSRSISIVFHLIGTILLMLFIPLSEAYAISHSQTLKDIGEILRLGRDLTNHIGVIIPYLIGSSIFYYSLLKLKYVQTWLVLFGYVGILFSITSSILVMFNIISLVSPIFIILSVPLVLQEITLELVFVFKKT